MPQHDSKQATTICLPVQTINMIELAKKNNAIFAKFSNQYIILLCLRKYLKQYQPEGFDERATCRYNLQSCTKQLKIFFSREEHHNVKMHRLVLQHSASFLCYLAVEEFLADVLKLLEEVTKPVTTNRANFELHELLIVLKAIHRKKYFKAQNILGLVIVIPKPKIIISVKPPSGHCGEPYRNNCMNSG